LRIAICEDETVAAETLTQAIQAWAAGKEALDVCIRHYTSAEAFLMEWPETPFDLIFLDIQMKHMTGIELAAAIRKIDQSVSLTFLTSHRQFVLKGYDVGALQYLIKPLELPKLLPVLERAHTIWQAQRVKSFVVSSDSGLLKIAYDDIFYIAMLAHNAEVCTAAGRYVIRKSAKELAALLPSQFLRCHRSYFVNLFQIDCVYQDSLLLRSGEDIPVSRGSLKQVKDAFLRLQWGD